MIDVIDGPETTLFVRTGPRIGWLTLSSLLKLADEPSSAPVRPRSRQPQPTIPVQLPAPTQSDDEEFPWLAQQYADQVIRERAWRHALGNRIIKYPGQVSCPFAGHANDDATPSASLAHKVGMLPVFTCHAAVHGMPDGRHHNIGELYRLMTIGELGQLDPDALRPGSMTQQMWAMRLLFDMGYMEVDEWARWPADFHDLRGEPAGSVGICWRDAASDTSKPACRSSASASAPGDPADWRVSQGAARVALDAVDRDVPWRNGQACQCEPRRKRSASSGRSISCAR